jgi:RimJ/RimL family protein N-acetyltransferase
LPALLAILSDSEVMRLALYGRPLTDDEARCFIEAEFAHDSTDVTKLGVLCRNSDKAVVGFAGLLVCKYFPGELEFGFVLTTSAQGHGFGTEIGSSLLDVGFRGLRRRNVYALCDPRNVASREVLARKLGMTLIDEIMTPDRGARLVFKRSHQSWENHGLEGTRTAV